MVETPLSIVLNEIEDCKLPHSIINNIQTYMRNDLMYKCLQEYFNKLYEKKEICEEKAYDKYVYPNCVCNNCPDNGRRKIFKRRDCSDCFEYECRQMNDEYAPQDFHECIKENPQYRKIISYPYVIENEDEDEECYETFYYSD